MTNRGKSLTAEDQAIVRLMAWKSFALYGLWAILLVYIASSAWFAYDSQIWLLSSAGQAVWAIERLAVVFGVFVLIGLTSTAMKILARFRLEQNLRFDVYAAVSEVVSQVLAKHLPEYQKLTTMVAVGEELLRPAEQISRRAARIQLALQQQLPGLGLADAINQIVRNALEAEGVAVTVSDVQTILTRIDMGSDLSNVVPLERP